MDELLIFLFQIRKIGKVNIVKEAIVMTKKQYFVSIAKQEITDIPIPGQGAEYEIIADDQDIETIKQLFKSADQYEKDASSYILLNPFDEWGVDDNREGYAEDIQEVYEILYKLGTEKTKNKISQLGILS